MESGSRNRCFELPSIFYPFYHRRLDAEQSSDLHEIILERHRRASTIVASNRTIDEWLLLLDDSILAKSAIDRLAHNAHQVVLKWESYSKRHRPGADGALNRPPQRTPS